MAAGVGVLLVSAIVATLLTLQREEAHITVVPLSLPAIGSMRESPTAALGAETPLQGAALSARF